MSRYTSVKIPRKICQFTSIAMNSSNVSFLGENIPPQSKIGLGKGSDLIRIVRDNSSEDPDQNRLEIRSGLC